MDLIKIGKFIQERRKSINLTQEELSEKLYVTDRAVSKWERGLSLPDADKMLDLCNILDINVNELLNGEKINMKDYNKKNEALLIDLAKQEEMNNKKTMRNYWVLIITIVIFYIAIVSLATYAFGDSRETEIVVLISTALFACVAMYAFKIEVDTGYYECSKCHHRYKTTYFKAILAPHVHTTRYLKCPKCNKRNWSKKVMSKE